MEARERACAIEMEAAVAVAAAEQKARQEEVRRRADALIERSREEASTDIEAMQAAAAPHLREAIKHIEWELCDI